MPEAAPAKRVGVLVVLARAVLRSRSLRVLVVGSLATLLLMGVGVGWAFGQARSAVCEELPREDLSLREMGQLRRSLERHVKKKDSPLLLTGREASFLLREQFELPAWLTVEGAQLHLEARVGEQGRCWNVAFHGRFEFEKGAAFVVPATLSIGQLDLSWMVGGRKFFLPAALLSVPGPETAELLDHLVSMQVADGTVYLRIDDPAVFVGPSPSAEASPE